MRNQFYYQREYGKRNRPLNLCKEFLRHLAVLLWPEVCPFCGKVDTSGPCAGCISLLKNIKPEGPRCFCCGKPVKTYEQEYCYDCSKTKHAFEQGTSLWLHKEPVKWAIYQFKYHNLRSGSVYFASAFYNRYGRMIEGWEADLIMPVPLHWKRMRKRGYNQALVLSEGLGKLFQIPVDGKSLMRIHQTAPQKKLDHSQRKKNLRHAFVLSDSFQPVRTVILVDDIYTTGNTLDAVAKLLKSRGVERIFFLTISIGEGD